MSSAKKKVVKILKILKRYFGESKLPVRGSAFKILVGCLLSLRTTDENAARAASALFEVASSPEEIVKLPLKKIEKLVYCSGFYKKKSRTIKHVAKTILEKYKGKVPSTQQELLSIKGIGRKTANIVLAFAYHKPVIPVDVHVHVISNRLGFVKTKNTEQTEQQLMAVVPRKYWHELNTLFVLHGKYICRTRTPRCNSCPIRSYCSKIGIAKR